MNPIVIIIIAIVGTPIIGGLLRGIDRKLTARMQSRIGPPLLQPFYDVIKLWAKEKKVIHNGQVAWAYAYLGFMITSIVVLALGKDLLMMLFIMAIGSICLVMGAFSVKSPYSHIGGNRELIQILAYEPILFMVALAIFLRMGSFKMAYLVTLGSPLLFSLPLAFFALGIVLLIKMRKSPFDISLCHHAHQEIVRGPVTEFSGKYLALVELAEWYETIIIMGLMTFFWLNPIWAGILITLAAYFIVLVIDNISARLTWYLLLSFSWTFGIGLVVLNMLGIYLLKK